MPEGFHIARVSQADSAKGLVKVEFPDRGNMVSGWIGLCENVFAVPAVGQTVGVIMSRTGQGVCLGAIMSDDNTPAVRVIRFDDGAYIRYDTVTKTMTIKADHVVIVRDAE